MKVGSFTNWNKTEYVMVFCLTMIFFQFYLYTGINATILKLLSFVTVPLVALYCYKTFTQYNKNEFFRIMKAIVVITFISILSAWLFKGQSIVLGYRAIAVQFSLLFFFYLYKRKPSIKSIENFSLFLGLLYCILWLYATSRFPTITFGISDENEMVEDLSRGMIRINFTGRISLIFAYFIALNKAYTMKKKIYIILSVVFFIFIVMQVTRQLILWSALVTIVYIFQKSKKLMIVGAITFLTLYFVGSNIKLQQDSVIGSMIELTQQQINDNSNGDENIRISEYRYFFTEWPSNILTRLIGNGYPHADSAYGNYYSNLQQKQRYFLSDVGYAQMYVVTGLIGLMLYICLFIKCLFRRMPEDLAYTKMFMLFLLPANIAANWYAKTDCQISMCIAVYLIAIYALPKTKKAIVVKNIKY